MTGPVEKQERGLLDLPAHVLRVIASHLVDEDRFEQVEPRCRYSGTACIPTDSIHFRCELVLSPFRPCLASIVAFRGTCQTIRKEIKPHGIGLALNLNAVELIPRLEKTSQSICEGISTLIVRGNELITEVETRALYRFIADLPNLESIILHEVNLGVLDPDFQSDPDETPTLAALTKLRSFSATGLCDVTAKFMRKLVLTAPALERIRLLSFDRPKNNLYHDPVDPTDDQQPEDRRLVDFLKQLSVGFPQLSHLEILNCRLDWPLVKGHLSSSLEDPTDPSSRFNIGKILQALSSFKSLQRLGPLINMRMTIPSDAPAEFDLEGTIFSAVRRVAASLRRACPTLRSGMLYVVVDRRWEECCLAWHWWTIRLLDGRDLVQACQCVHKPPPDSDPEDEEEESDESDDSVEDKNSDDEGQDVDDVYHDNHLTDD